MGYSSRVNQSLVVLYTTALIPDPSPVHHRSATAVLCAGYTYCGLLKLGSEPCVPHLLLARPNLIPILFWCLPTPQVPILSDTLLFSPCRVHAAPILLTMSITRSRSHQLPSDGIGSMSELQCIECKQRRRSHPTAEKGVEDHFSGTV